MHIHGAYCFRGFKNLEYNRRVALDVLDGSGLNQRLKPRPWSGLVIHGKTFHNTKRGNLVYAKVLDRVYLVA